MQIEKSTENVHRIRLGGKEIVLVGTAHVSKESVGLVESVIQAEQPDTVCVELCQARFQSIMRKDQWLDMDIIKVIKEKKSFLLLANLLLASFQKRIGEKLGVKPGEEMIRAVQTAESINAGVCLADRDITVTLSRTWRSTGFISKVKLLFQLVLTLDEAEDIDEKAIEQMKEADMLQSILAEVEKTHPQLRKIIIDERDQYLAHKIKTSPGAKTVAVVGAGHVPGILKYIGSDIDIAPLETLPPKGKAGGIFKWGIPGAIVLLILAGFYYGGVDVGKGMVLWWCVITGLLGGAGAVAAFGHPLTVLSAVLAAPLTTLHPLIAAGWVSGLVEAVARKPKVRDLESLSQDILSARGFWRNKVTRVLLVVVFTNIGASIGTFVAVPMMIKILGN
ncbi:MAG: TraB/GumN family protein [Desulfobacterales bacterium]|nr:TraB/GumN family protein [Desulfobacterales bacterium]